METAPGSSADISIPAAPAAMVHTQRKRVSKPLRPQTEAPLLPEKQLVLPKSHQKSPCDVVTPIHVDRLHSWLEGYDKNVQQYLCEGFLNGFKIPFHGKMNNSPVKSRRIYSKPKTIAIFVVFEHWFQTF